MAVNSGIRNIARVGRNLTEALVTKAKGFIKDGEDFKPGTPTLDQSSFTSEELSYLLQSDPVRLIRRIKVMGYQKSDSPIKRTELSNVFAARISCDQAADLIIDKSSIMSKYLCRDNHGNISGTKPIPLDGLSKKDQGTYESLEKISSLAMQSTLIMDVIITMITGCAYAGGLSTTGILGGGFNDFKFNPELIQDLLKGNAKFEISEIGEEEDKNQSTTRKVTFKITNRESLEISSGTFLWSNLKK